MQHQQFLRQAEPSRQAGQPLDHAVDFADVDAADLIQR